MCFQFSKQAKKSQYEWERNEKGLTSRNQLKAMIFCLSDKKERE
jgi:hypothetical protein